MRKSILAVSMLISSVSSGNAVSPGCDGIQLATGFLWIYRQDHPVVDYVRQVVFNYSVVDGKQSGGFTMSFAKSPSSAEYTVMIQRAALAGDATALREIFRIGQRHHTDNCGDPVFQHLCSCTDQDIVDIVRNEVVACSDPGTPMDSPRQVGRTVNTPFGSVTCQ